MSGEGRSRDRYRKFKSGAEKLRAKKRRELEEVTQRGSLNKFLKKSKLVNDPDTGKFSSIISYFFFL